MGEDLLSKLDDSYALRLLEEMVAIDSVVGREGELAEFLQGELEALGLEVELHEVEPGRPNVYARLEGEGPGRRLNFDGHTDTVPVVEGWETDPLTPVKVLQISSRIKALDITSRLLSPADSIPLGEAVTVIVAPLRPMNLSVLRRATIAPCS